MVISSASVRYSDTYRGAARYHDRDDLAMLIEVSIMVPCIKLVLLNMYTYVLTRACRCTTLHYHNPQPCTTMLLLTRNYSHQLNCLQKRYRFLRSRKTVSAIPCVFIA